MKIAYFSPVSPQKTGIADYSERELLPYLSKYCDIDVYIDKGLKPSNHYLIENFNCFSYDLYEKKAHEYDIPLYHMGNNDYHGFIYNSLRKYPGITVLHDIYLHGFLWTQSLAKGDSARYLSEFEYCYGNRGVKVAQEAILSSDYPEFTYPLIKRIINNSLGIICHSEFGIGKVLREEPNSICTVIPHPWTIKKNHQEDNGFCKEELQTKNRIKNKFPIVASFGFIGYHKQYDTLLNVFIEFLIEYPDAQLLIIGQDNIGLSKTIHELGLDNHVILTGYISENAFKELLTVSDFCLNLRYPTAGETSGSVLRIMSLGKPVIVSNIGWFSELPNNSCLKVDVDSDQENVLLELFMLLAEKINLRELLGKNAREYIIKKHDPELAAKSYYEFIQGILSGDEFIENKISQNFIDLGLNKDDNELMKYTIQKIYPLMVTLS